MKIYETQISPELTMFVWMSRGTFAKQNVCFDQNKSMHILSIYNSAVAKPLPYHSCNPTYIVGQKEYLEPFLMQVQFLIHYNYLQSFNSV